MRYFEIISEAFNTDDTEPFTKAGFSLSNAKAFVEYGVSLEQAIAERNSRLKLEKKEAAEQKMLDNIGELAKKNIPVSYSAACAIIASEDDIFDLVIGWTTNTDYAEVDKPDVAAKFLSVLKRIHPPVKKHLFRGQMPFGEHDSDKRGFHSWSANRATAEDFAEQRGVVLEINRAIQGVALSDIIHWRMRLHPNESHYGGPQAEWFVVDQPEQFKR